MDLRAITILFGLGLGCGEVERVRDGGMDGPPGDDFSERSGSRLKRRGHDLDGTRVFDGLYDAARGESCAIITWSDGARYCTPVQRAGSIVFGDAACTAKVGLTHHDPCASAGPTYFGEYTDEPCGAVMSSLFTPGAASSATTFYRASDAGCLGPYDLDDGDQLVALGSTVATSELATVTRSQPVGSHRLRRLFDESADGLRIAAVPMHDSELATDCFLSGENAATWSCLPQNVHYAGQYADAACSQLITLSNGDCSLGPFALHNETPGCRYAKYAVYRTGPEIDTDSGYENSSGTCTAQDYGSEVRIHGVAERVSLPIATLATPVAGPRVQQVSVSTDTDTFVVPFGLRDTGKHTDCAIGQAADGVERCLPYGAFAQLYFRDPACTDAVTLLRFYRGAAACEPSAPPAFGRSYLSIPDPCRSSQQIHLVGAEVTTPLYQNFGECQLVTSGQNSYYELGPVVPATEFVAAVPVTEP